jgi:hypothetical protein
MAKRYPTEEEAADDTAKLLVHMRDYFAKYYGPRCEEYEKDCPVCEVWQLYDNIKIWIK